MAKTVRSSAKNPPQQGMSLDRRSLIGVIALVVFVGGYTALFYGTDANRWKYLTLLLRPDDVFGYWTAGGLGIFDRTLALIIASIYLTSAYSLGSLTFRVLRGNYDAPLERFVLAMSVGLGLWSTLTLLVGLLGGLHWQWLFVALAIGLPIAEIMVAIRPAKGRAVVENGVTRRLGRSLVLPIAFGLFVLIYALAGLMPATDFDVLEYHLQVPKEWSERGQIDFLPHNVYGNMPLGAEMHVLATMTLLRGIIEPWYAALAGKLAISLFAPLTALGLYVAGRRFYSETGGMIAAAVYLSLPWIAHVSFGGLVDGVLAHYTFAAIYAAMIADSDSRKICVAGLLAGCAAACKYPGLIFALPMVLAILGWNTWKAKLESRTPIFVAASISLCAFAIIAAPWYLKNAALTGNPVYPLAANLFPSRTRTPEKIAQWERAHQVPRDADGNRYAPSQLINSAANVGLKSEWLSPVAWPLAMIGLIATWRRTETRMLLVATLWIFAVWWFATHRIDRFWLPAAPLLCLLASGTVAWSMQLVYQRTLVVFATLDVVAASLMLMGPITRENGSLQTVAEPRWLSPLESLRYGLESHRALAELCKPTDAILLVGDAVPFDLPMPTYYNTCFDDSLLEEWTNDRSAEEIRQAFKQRGIRYVLVDWTEVARYRSPGNYGYTEYVQPAVFAKLVEQRVLHPPVRQERAEQFVLWEIYEVR